MTKHEDLRKEFLAIAELRLVKVEEIRELLSISPAASIEEVLRIVKCGKIAAMALLRPN
jgi:hypothetical protein